MLPLLLTLLALPNLVPILSTDAQKVLQVLYEWKFLNWDGVDPFISNFSNVLDVHPDKNGRIFVTTPLLELDKRNVTLSTIQDGRNGPGGPLLAAYPENDQSSGCDQLLSVFTITIDECDRLWMMDMGSKDCGPKIVIYNSITNERLRTHTIPKNQTQNIAFFIHAVVDIKNRDCNNPPYFYIGMPQHHIILGYSWADSKSWLIDDEKAFGLDNGTSITIKNDRVDLILSSGITSLSLSPHGFFNRRYLYFSSLVSFQQKFVDTEFLQQGNSNFLKEYYESTNLGSSQVGAFHISPITGVAFLLLVNSGTLACWNIGVPFKQDNIENVHEFEIKEDIISIKVTSNSNNREEIWITSLWTQSPETRLQRIYHAYVDDVIKNKKCATTSKTDPLTQDGWSKQQFATQPRNS